MTEPGAEPRARGGVGDDTLYIVRRTGFADFAYARLCTRAELWAAIEAYGDARANEYWELSSPAIDEARSRLRAILGLEPE